ncbi:MAG: protein TonB [Sulfitobacter sp.]|jgi:protein TonB
MIRHSPTAKVVSLGVAVVILVGGAGLNISLQPVEIAGAGELPEAQIGSSFEDMAAGRLTAEPVEDLTGNPEPAKTAEPAPLAQETPAKPIEMTPAAATPSTSVPMVQAHKDPAVTPPKTAAIPPASPSPIPALEAALHTLAVTQALLAPPAKPIPPKPVEPVATPPLTTPAVTPALMAPPTTVAPTTVAPVKTTMPAVTTTPQTTAAPPLETLQATTDDAIAPPLSLRPKRKNPAQARAAAEKQPVKKAAKNPGNPKPPKVQQGNAKRNNTKGAADGTKQQAKAKTTGTSARKSAQSGTAAVSNYPGLVMRKISRVPKPRVRSRGTAVIAFRVSASGGLAAVSLARSSGNGDLDRAGLEMIRKAAPFPRPPAGARRSFSLNVKGR